MLNIESIKQEVKNLLRVEGVNYIRIEQLLTIHKKWLELVIVKYSSAEIVKILLKYEKDLKLQMDSSCLK